MTQRLRLKSYSRAGQCKKEISLAVEHLFPSQLPSLDWFRIPVLDFETPSFSLSSCNDLIHLQSLRWRVLNWDVDETSSFIHGSLSFSLRSIDSSCLRLTMLDSKSGSKTRWDFDRYLWSPRLLPKAINDSFSLSSELLAIDSSWKILQADRIVPFPEDLK